MSNQVEYQIVRKIICKAAKLGYSDARVLIENEPADCDEPDCNIKTLAGRNKAIAEAFSGDEAQIIFKGDIRTTVVRLAIGEGEDIVTDGSGHLFDAITA